jgi:tetraacyldisaccharide 4'-kinase
MKIIKPKFWLEKNFISYSLYPLTIFTYITNLYKKLSFKKKFTIKTICVGNLYIGGTGKTSLAIEIHKVLNKRFKTIFIKKRYEDQKDEFNLLKKRGEIISEIDRESSLTIAQKNKFELALLDDGLQQKNIAYDLKIVCFNTSEGFGNNFLLPAGPLRENINELKNYHIAFLNGERKNNNLYSKLKSINKNLNIFEGKYEPKNLKNFNRKKKYLMFCGIGNPQEFENTLKKHKFDVKHKIIYPDHYMIPNNEINRLKKKAKKLDLTIITTEKDYLRLNKAKRKSIKFLEVKLEIKNMNKLEKILISSL